MADFDLDKYIENLKIKKEDLEQQRKKLSNIFFNCYCSIKCNFVLYILFLLFKKNYFIYY